MKILVINKFNYANGGADRHFLDVVKLYQTQGHDVAVFCMQHPRNESSPWEGYFVSQVGFSSQDSIWNRVKGALRMGYSFEAKRNITRLLNDFQPDIVHLHNIYHQITPSILPVIKHRGIPVVMTVHDYYLINPHYLRQTKAEEFFCWMKTRPYQSIVKSTLLYTVWNIHRILGSYSRYIDHYLAPSTYLKNILVQAGMEANHISVIPHFVSDETQGGTAPDEKQPYMLYFGRIAHDKGVDRLISMVGEAGDMRLLLAGPIDPGFSLGMNDQGNVRYLGQLPQKELQAYIRKARVVVSPSRLPETFGLIALEAMQCNKPFVGFKTGALPEIIEHGVTGYLCLDESDFIQRVREVMGNEQLQTVMGQAAHKKAAGLGKLEYYAKIMDLFQGVGRRY